MKKIDIMRLTWQNVKVGFQHKYESKDRGRMFLYLFIDEDDPESSKFGQRWVHAGLDPIEDCQKRIWSQLQTLKIKAVEGKITCIGIWDVEDYAIKEGIHAIGKHVDDNVRSIIGFHKYGEWHYLPGWEFKIKVNEFFAKQGQPLPVAALSTYQYNEADDIITQFRKFDAKVIASELCARFGKTIWAGVVAVELDVELVIIASYVKTVFTSFANDFTSFEQFKDYVNVNCDDEDYKEKIKAAFKDGKRVVAYFSLVSGSNRQKRIDFLTNLTQKKMLIVDEADYGAKRKNQVEMLIAKLSKIDYTLLMTGTDIDKATSLWIDHIDYMNSVTYIELLNQKRETKLVA